MSSWAHARTPRPRIRPVQSRPSKGMCLQAAELRWATCLQWSNLARIQLAAMEAFPAHPSTCSFTAVTGYHQTNHQARL
jgi:hypothetical protein